MVLEVRDPGPCAGAGHLAVSVLRQHEASCERNGEQAACLCLWVILPMSVSSQDSSLGVPKIRFPLLNTISI